ncbi:hypothetical protein [Desulfobacca acetoxidans]|uniref:Uncharacterized protein n=1 Tax=Desulfobacca acetoxidans (strain ATCC 700848 / DSM 11109 / ASRB2) TaxID=880072 RepID=F2NJ62_DESAR|nr:hypothetical protein [Desulfobacca acetoxidans]AEB08020.1 hypothetical protein Desac_0123 [Desulfobacca acetoxidans DSM 11109]
MSGVASFGKTILATRLFWRQALTFILALFCLLFIFFLSLHLALDSMWDQATQSVRVEIEREADTIARLLVFEFSHLKELLDVQPQQQSPLDEHVKRLLWEKVTFNKAIRGIELIHGPSDPTGRHITYSYYLSDIQSTEWEQGPQKSLKSLMGTEGELIEIINREQRVDKNRLESINRGPKPESEMLLRYFPFYIPLLDQGAVFWGVAKVGINTDALRRFLVLLDEEDTRLRWTLAWIMGVSVVLSLTIGLAGFYWLSQKTATPLTGYGKINAALQDSQGSDISSVLTYLARQKSYDIVEYEQVQFLCLHLGHVIQALGEKLIASERQASLGRLAGRVMAVRATDWSRLLQPLPLVWQEIDLHSLTTQINALLTAILPPGTLRLREDQPLSNMFGCPGYLVQAILSLADFALQEKTELAELSWHTWPLTAGGFGLVVGFGGRHYSQEEIFRLLRPLQTQTTPPPPLGPFLAAAVARQHGGRFDIQPGPQGGLQLRLEVPDSRPPTDELSEAGSE